jgi:hypothetical protein
MSYRAEKQDSNNCWFRLYCASVAVLAYDVQRKDGRELDWQFNQEKCICTVTSVVCWSQSNTHATLVQFPFLYSLRVGAIIRSLHHSRPVFKCSLVTDGLINQNFAIV